ncbi:retrotransposon nucleocapsid protein [Salix suchowensis]|nr:retrotransposon nucleocapsid protein [Salix suchowensis]
MQDHIEAIIPDEEKRRLALDAEGRKSEAVKSAFSVWWWYEEAINEEHTASALAVETREQRRRKAESVRINVSRNTANENNQHDMHTESTVKEPFKTHPLPEDHWTFPDPTIDSSLNPSVSTVQGEALRPHLLLSLSTKELKHWILAYQEDSYYDDKGRERKTRRFSSPLLGFREAITALSTSLMPTGDTVYVYPEAKSTKCSQRRETIRSPSQRIILLASSRQRCHRIRRSCDICQKTKTDRRGKQGGLRPSHIPQRPFATVSMDMITGLPESGTERFTAVLAFVDKLTKFAILVPTFNSLDQVGFASHFITKIVNIYGLPTRIICDRDKRWTSSFWRSVAAYYGSHLVLSSAHHPQTDGQTEILNAQIEMMLRAYVAKDRSSWAHWLGALSRVQFLRTLIHWLSPRLPSFGYEPQIDMSGLVPDSAFVQRPLASQRALSFVADLQHHGNLLATPLLSPKNDKLGRTTVIAVPSIR